jgi:predicted nuclease of predicted toxin-antitoxin system
MTDRIRFHCDENIDPAIADGLRRRGIEVTMPADVGLVGASDDDHLTFAAREQRVIVTHDEDFLALAHSGVAHCGLACCHTQSRSIGQILGALLLIYDCLDPADMRDHIEFL